MKSEIEIAKDIKALCEGYVKNADRENEIAHLKETIEYMVHEVFNLLSGGRDLVESCKQDGMTLNQLEAEGFVRACLTIKSEFEHWDDYLSGVIKNEFSSEETDESK